MFVKFYFIILTFFLLWYIIIRIWGVFMNQENNNTFITNTDNDVLPKNDKMIICGRCGAEMKKDARYCMKCGNLNYAHQENTFMKQYAIDNIKQGNYIPGLETAKNNGMEVPKEVVNHPYRACLITNIILHFIPIVLLVIAILLLDVNFSFNIVTLVGLILYIIFFFIAYAYQRILIKSGEKWWYYFIPIYNFYIFFKIALGNGWLFLLMLVPIVGMFAVFVALYKLGKKFSRNGWLTLFFPIIMFMIIAFDKNAHYDSNDKAVVEKKEIKVDSKGRTEVENSYRAKRTLFSIVVLIGFGLVVWLGWDYIIIAYEFFLEQLKEVKDILQI